MEAWLMTHPCFGGLFMRDHEILASLVCQMAVFLLVDARHLAIGLGEHIIAPEPSPCWEAAQRKPFPVCTRETFLQDCLWQLGQAHAERKAGLLLCSMTCLALQLTCTKSFLWPHSVTWLTCACEPILGASQTTAICGASRLHTKPLRALVGFVHQLEWEHLCGMACLWYVLSDPCSILAREVFGRVRFVLWNKHSGDVWLKRWAPFIWALHAFLWRMCNNKLLIQESRVTSLKSWMLLWK